MYVRDWMSATPAVVSASTPVPEARSLMARWFVRHLPVVEGERLVGIVADRDLRLNLPPSTAGAVLQEIDALLARLSVGQVMSRPAITIGPEQSIAQAASVMVACKIGALPVVQQGELIGIITDTDLLRALSGSSRTVIPAAG